MKKKIVYLVTQYRSRRSQEFQGVFSSKAKAIAACRNANYAYTPMVLNQNLPDERYTSTTTVYPIQPN